MPFYHSYAIAQASRDECLPNAIPQPTGGSENMTDPGSIAIFLNLARGSLGEESERPSKIGNQSIKRHSWALGKRHVKNLQNLIGLCGSPEAVSFRCQWVCRSFSEPKTSLPVSHSRSKMFS